MNKGTNDDGDDDNDYDNGDEDNHQAKQIEMLLNDNQLNCFAHTHPPTHTHILIASQWL